MPRHPTRPRLGRGLSSLIRSSRDREQPAGEYRPVSDDAAAAAAPEAPTPPAAGSVAAIPLASIRRNPYQPRRSFDEESLGAMAESIRTHGVLQPVLVAEAGIIEGRACYELIAGERRLRAAELAGVTELPAIVRRTTPQQMLELALIENIHRTDLNPLDRAGAYRDLMDRFSLTQQQVAERVGEARASLANYLRLLDLCDEGQRLVGEGTLSFGHGKVLAGLTGQPDLQADLARRAAREKLSVRQLEALLEEAAARTGQEPERQPPAARERAAYVVDLEGQLTEAIGARVHIRPGRGKHSGRIVIEYHGLEDFDRIAAAFGLELES